jgi:hypothetical protein
MSCSGILVHWFKYGDVSSFWGVLLCNYLDQFFGGSTYIDTLGINPIVIFELMRKVACRITGIVLYMWYPNVARVHRLRSAGVISVSHTEICNPDCAVHQRQADSLDFQNYPN